ncbi:uncharacterized protein LOC132196381 [Neocloeon triangulifer]|uniref:uncharacterized protein LOC132196381 n=1 Tax=Neocloeon triangulifer TaxID=2078957 RepID=UPI00286EC639|nr:uncharacterized protein LOC132196381 [Neocloeon triangulifer]
MAVVGVARFCFVFSLRQGCIIIAVVQLFLSAVVLFLLTLGMAHAQDMAAILAADMEETAMHEDPTSLLYSPANDGLAGPARSHNEEQLLKAENLATVIISCMYTSMALAAVKLVACILLLYGTLMRHRQCLLPWACVVLAEMVLVFSGLVTCLAVGGGHHITVVFAIGTIYLMILFYLWTAVVSFYKQLCLQETLHGSVRQVTAADAPAKGYLQFSNKPYSV